MIARSWSCRTDGPRGAGLLAHLRNTGIADARAAPGYLGHLLARRTDENTEVEFTLVTFWSDMRAVRRFAGGDAERARLYPGDEQHVVAVDDHVIHSDIVDHGCPAFASPHTHSS